MVDVDGEIRLAVHDAPGLVHGLGVSRIVGLGAGVGLCFSGSFRLRDDRIGCGCRRGGGIRLGRSLGGGGLDRRVVIRQWGRCGDRGIQVPMLIALIVFRAGKAAVDQGAQVGLDGLGA